jgi:chromosome segregation ATPase
MGQHVELLEAELDRRGAALVALEARCKKAEADSLAAGLRREEGSARTAQLEAEIEKLRRNLSRAETAREELAGDLAGVREQSRLQLESLRVLKLEVEQHKRVADLAGEECRQYKGSFDDGVTKIEHLHLNRKQLLEEIDRLHHNIDQLDQKILSQGIQIDKLRGSNTAKEQLCLDLEAKLAEQRKAFNHKRIECEALQKSSGDKVAFLEKKVDMLTEQNERLRLDLEAGERKLVIANEVALGNRKMISE